jgi:hypothetical protein
MKLRERRLSFAAPTRFKDWRAVLAVSGASALEGNGWDRTSEAERTGAAGKLNGGHQQKQGSDYSEHNDLRRVDWRIDAAGNVKFFG